MDWVKRLKQNDMSAFDEVYLESKKAVFYAIYAVVKNEDTTEDLMQEVYIDLLENVSSLKNDVNLVAYLVTSAKNKAINFYNRNKRQVEFMTGYKNYSYATDKYFDTGLLAVIRDTLTEEQFEVFILKVIGEYSFKEISKMKNIPIGTLTWMYQECRSKLQGKLKEGQ